jgi:short-subunit dehydrogenase
MAYKNIAVIGASGVLGQPVVQQLAKAGFDLTLISRDSEKLKSLFNELDKVKYVQVESSDAEGLKKAFKGKPICEAAC